MIEILYFLIGVVVGVLATIKALITYEPKKTKKDVFYTEVTEEVHSEIIRKRITNNIN